MSRLSFDFLKTELSGEHKDKVDSYLNSALYYMITGRRGAWAYKNEDCVLIICAHPHIDDRLMVFPEIGRGDYTLTASVLNMLDVPANGVQLARYSEADLVALRSQLSKLNDTSVSDLRVGEEAVMDWRYPVHILDTEKVAAMDGSDFKQVRKKFRHAARDVTHVPLRQENALRLMRSALKFWEGNMIYNTKDTDDMSEFYLALFEIMERNPESIDGLFFMQGRKPLGFSVWDVPQADTANFLVSLCDTSVAGLSDYQVVSSCQDLHARGVKYLNKGGSETPSLDAFKAKFMPARSLDILSAEVVYRQAEYEHVEVHTIVPPLEDVAAAAVA